MSDNRNIFIVERVPYFVPVSFKLLQSANKWFVAYFWGNVVCWRQMVPKVTRLIAFVSFILLWSYDGISCSIVWRL